MVAGRRTPGRSCAEGRSGIIDDQLQGGAGALAGLQAAGDVEEGAGMGDQAAAQRLIGAAECDGRKRALSPSISPQHRCASPAGRM